MFINILGQNVSILIESSSGSSKKIDPYLATFKMRRGIPNAYILDCNSSLFLLRYFAECRSVSSFEDFMCFDVHWIGYRPVAG